MFGKAFITAAAAVAAALVTAGPALAAPGCTGAGCVTASATVNQSISLTGLSSAVTFPAGNVGQTVTAGSAEAYAVDTNDPAGMTLTITPDDDALWDATHTYGINNTLVSVTETGQAPGTKTFSGATPLTVDAETAAGSWSYAESWSLTIPTNAAAASYSEGFTYLAVGN